MILVDIYVPSVDQIYNFNLSEDIGIAAIVNEIIGMISQKEQTTLNGNQDDLNLYSVKDRRILPRDNTLSDCNIMTGSYLMLV